MIRSVSELDFTPVGDVFPSPLDWRDHVIYEIMIDRFDRGSDDLPLFDPEKSERGEFDRQQGGTFQGGTIKGITRRLDYLQGLGCTALWITPPIKNRLEDPTTFHGYGIQNFLEVDPRFGTMDDLQELVREAHQRKMYVILDVVINHTGDNWAYPGGEPYYYSDDQRYDFGYWRDAQGNSIEGDFGPDDAVWPVEFQDPEVYNRRGEVTAGAELYEDIVGDLCHLKDLDLTLSHVRDALIRCFKWWIAQTDCDGFRLDALKNARPKPAGIFVNAIREYCMTIGKHNFLMFAEIVGGDELVTKYVGRNTPNPEDPADEEYPRLTAVLDFPLYAHLEEVLKGTCAPSIIAARYEEFQHHYRDFGKAGEYFVTFLDNHDQAYRRCRRFMHGETDWRLAALGVGYLLTSMGIPCIYYGTEQCLDGGGEDDVYIRETMFGGPAGGLGAKEGHLFDTEHPAYKRIAQIAKIRHEQPTLRYGRQYFCNVSGDGQTFGPPEHPGGIFALTRILDVDALLIALNVDTEPRTLYVGVDPVFMPERTELRDLLSDRVVRCERAGDATAVKVELGGRELAIFRKVE
jgi:glycosidase